MTEEEEADRRIRTVLNSPRAGPRRACYIEKVSDDPDLWHAECTQTGEVAIGHRLSVAFERAKGTPEREIMELIGVSNDE